MELPIKPKSKKAKKIAKRKERRKFVKWLVQNEYFYTWYQVRKRHKKITSSIYYSYFVGCRFFKSGECILNDQNFKETLHCKCRVYYQYKQNKI